MSVSKDASWSIKDQVPSLAIGDLGLAIDFYGRLGFEVTWRWPKSQATHVGLKRSGIALMLVCCEPAERAEIYYVVDDVMACYDFIVSHRPWELAERSLGSRPGRDCSPKLSLASPVAPSVKAHGHFDFTVVDPWGHQLTFGSEAVT